MLQENKTTFVMVGDQHFDLRTPAGKMAYEQHLAQQAAQDVNAQMLAGRLARETVISNTSSLGTGADVTGQQLKDRFRSSVQIGAQGLNFEKSARPVENAVQTITEGNNTK